MNNKQVLVTRGYRNYVVLEAKVFPEVWVKLFYGNSFFNQEMQIFL